QADMGKRRVDAGRMDREAPSSSRDDLSPGPPCRASVCGNATESAGAFGNSPADRALQLESQPGQRDPEQRRYRGLRLGDGKPRPPADRSRLLLDRLGQTAEARSRVELAKDVRGAFDLSTQGADRQGHRSLVRPLYP